MSENMTKEQFESEVKLRELADKIFKREEVYPIMKHFRFMHLPPELRAISCQFAELAHSMSLEPRNAETSSCLRKLLEAKDCAVRAVL